MEKLTNEEVYNIIKEQEKQNNITYMDATGLNYIDYDNLTIDTINGIFEKTKRDTESLLKNHATAVNYKWVNDTAMTKIIQTLMNDKDKLEKEKHELCKEYDNLTIENSELKNKNKTLEDLLEGMKKELKSFKDKNSELNKKLLEVNDDDNIETPVESYRSKIMYNTKNHKMGDEHIMTTPEEFRI